MGGSYLRGVVLLDIPIFGLGVIFIKEGSFINFGEIGTLAGSFIREERVQPVLTQVDLLSFKWIS